jgi:hypothetical protein
MQLNHQSAEFLINNNNNNNNTSRTVLSGLSLNTLNTKQPRQQQQQQQQQTLLVANQLQQLILQQQLINESVSDSLNSNSIQQQAAAAARYKTELCRSYQENGTCKYGEKCQFAHGFNELRSMMRHPKYKTELCRTFHAAGYCPYGPRCHFVHENTSQNKQNNQKHQSPLKKNQQHQENITNSLLMCASDSLSREFNQLNLNEQFLSFTSSANGFLGSSMPLNGIGSSSSSGVSSRKESTSSSSSSTEISPRSLSPSENIPHNFGFSSHHLSHAKTDSNSSINQLSSCFTGSNLMNYGNSFGNGLLDNDNDDDVYEPSTQLLVNQILSNINYF